MLSNLADIDLRLIRVFLTVVDTGGLTPAQAILNVGQPTISTQLATLEARLGFRLCERGRAGFRLTAKGERFAQLSRKLLANVSDFAAEARNMDRKLVGTVRIGIIGQMSIHNHAMISKAIALFRRRSQMVQFSITILSPSELEARLLTGDIQVAIGYFWQRLANLEYTPILLEHQEVYCGQGHPLFKHAAKVSKEILTDYEWVWTSYPIVGVPQSLIPINITEEADNMEAVAILILSGQHIGYLPTHFAAAYVQRGLMVAINPAELNFDFTFHLVTHKLNSHDDILRALVEDMLTTHLSEDPTELER